ncbi:MAG: hypothetical protein ACRC5Q_03010, partial [Culicoidibacterales bacterium]
REKFVRAQQVLAAAEIVANSAVAITKAAVEGGVAAPFTIAATLVALAAGLAQARALAQQAAFYSGGEYQGQGYTGDGNPRAESKSVGKKPYTYHKREFIFDHKNTDKYRDIFHGVHQGHVDLKEWQSKAKAYDIMNNYTPMYMNPNYVKGINGMSDEHVQRLESKMDLLISAINGQERMKFTLDQNGIGVIASKFVDKTKRINKLAQ